MPLKRRHARIPAAMALVALAALAILWAAARTPFARGLIADRIAEAAGLPASVAQLRVGFFPSPRLDIRGLAIAQPPGFGEEPLLDVARIEVLLPWRSVFGGTRIKAVTVSDATARLRVSAEGASNWSELFPEPAPAAGTAPPARWFLGSLDLEPGTIDYRDAGQNTQWQLTAIAITGRNIAPAAEFPLELRLGGVVGTNTIHYAMKGQGRLDPAAGRYEASSLEFRGWLGGDPLPLAGAELSGTLGRASYASADGAATLEAGRFELAEIPGRFDGRLDFGEPALAARFRVATEPFAPRAPAIIFGHPLPVTTDPAAFESLQVAFEAALQDGTLTLDPLSGRLDNTNFEGRAVPGQRLVRANLDRIDLNRYLPAAAIPPSRREKKATLEALAAELEKLDLDAEIRIGEARFAGGMMREAVLRVAPDGASAP
jgi:AsmA protein